MDEIKKLLVDRIRTTQTLFNDDGLLENICKTIDVINHCVFALEGKVLIAGNGGSAADAQHMAAELVGKFKQERKPISAISLTTNTSILTAIGNDYGYDKVFERQIEAIGKKGDVFIAISTSGKSKNIINALKTAKKLNLSTILLTGNFIKNLEFCDYVISVPSNKTEIIQENHLVIEHIICEQVEKSLSLVI